MKILFTCLFLYFSFSIHKALFKEEVEYGCSSIMILIVVDVILLLLLWSIFF